MGRGQKRRVKDQDRKILQNEEGLGENSPRTKKRKTRKKTDV